MNSLSDLSTVPCLCIAKCVALFLKIIFTLLGVLFYFSFLLAKLIAYVETDRRKEKKKGQHGQRDDDLAIEIPRVILKVAYKNRI